KNCKPYLTIRRMDKSGEVDAKVWDNVEEVSARFEKNDFLEISAKASLYLGKMQLVISELRKMPEEDVELGDFLPETDRDIKVMESELAAIIGTLSSSWLKGLLESLFSDPELMALYRVAP